MLNPLNIHKKALGLLKVNNFYDGLIAFLNYAIKNHFISIIVKKKLFIYDPTTN